MSNESNQIPNTLQSKARRYMREHGVRYLPALAAITAEASAESRAPARGSLREDVNNSAGVEAWLQALGIDDLATYEPAEMWGRSAGAAHLIPIPIGIFCAAPARGDVAVEGETGVHSQEVAFLDLDALSSGVVQGMIGTGRTALDQWVIGALSVLNGPDKIQFVVLDFKGALAGEQLSGIPHVAACLDVLHEDSGAKISALCSMIEAEIVRREQILRIHHVSSIQQYRRKSGAAALPDLIVFVTEAFEYMELYQTRRRILRVASMAAHAGVHLIVSGQLLGTEVDEIREQIKFGISLRAANDRASTRVLGRSDAVELPLASGRAYLVRYPSISTDLECLQIFGPLHSGALGSWEKVLAKLSQTPHRADEFSRAIAALAVQTAKLDLAVDGRGK